MKKSEEVIDWIHSLLSFGIKPGLKRMEWMLDTLGNPEKKSTFIHIAGTNGKGSTVSYLRNVLQSAGYSVGTFTSPYIECFEERISLNGHPISEEHLVQSAQLIRPLVEELAQTELGSPTEFEVITAIAFNYFAEMKPDIVLMEVGLGGRLDSTNVLTPIASVITSIGHDHMHILGDTLEKIAFEKAGIIKQDIPVISGVKQKQAQEIIRKVSKQKNAALFQIEEDYDYKKTKWNEQEQHFKFQSQFLTVDDAVLQMKGEHQIHNASVALMVLSLLHDKQLIKLEKSHYTVGIRKTSWIGRFEVLHSSAPFIVIDGAHNEEGLLALKETLVNQYPTRKYRFVFAVTKEKDVNRLLAPFSSIDLNILFTGFNFFRAADPEELYKKSDMTKKSWEADWHKAISSVIKELHADEMLVITGSLYFISDVRKAFKNGELSFKENKHYM